MNLGGALDGGVGSAWVTEGFGASLAAMGEGGSVDASAKLGCGIGGAPEFGDVAVSGVDGKAAEDRGEVSEGSRDRRLCEVGSGSVIMAFDGAEGGSSVFSGGVDLVVVSLEAGGG